MNFYVSSDHFNLVRLGKKQATVVYVDFDHGFSLPHLGLNFVTNEEKETMREGILVTRITLTHFAELAQEDAEAAGYLYLHQLHQDLQKKWPDILPDSVVRVTYFKRVKDLG